MLRSGHPIMDLLMGLFRGAVFRHGGGARKQPIKQPTEMPTSTMAFMGRFPSLMDRFPTLRLNGAFHRCRPKGPFYLVQGARFGSVRLRFGGGTVRALPVFGSGGSSSNKGFLCFSTV